MLALRRFSAPGEETDPPRRTLPCLPRGPPCLPAVPPSCSEGSGRMRSRSCRPGDRQDQCELLHPLPACAGRSPGWVRRGARSSARRACVPVRNRTGDAAFRLRECVGIGRDGAPRARCPVRNRARSRHGANRHRFGRSRTLNAEGCGNLPQSAAAIASTQGWCSSGRVRLKVRRPRLKPCNGAAIFATASAGEHASHTTRSAGRPAATP